MKNSLIKCILGIAPIFFGVCYLSNPSLFKIKMTSDELQFQLDRSPTTVDPIEFDYFTHHVAFRSVLGTLVTQYGPNGLTGELSESWRPSSDFKTWIFQIRSGLKFSDGSSISAREVALSWSRINFLFNKKKSHSEFFDSLEGAENTKSPTDIPSGLIVGGPETLTIKLKKPLPKLAEIVSFGIYSIVSPSDFDPETGNWINPKYARSSNRYEIENWKNGFLLLRLRGDFPLIGHPKPYEHVRVSWDEGKAASNVAQMTFGPSNGKSPEGSKSQFFGSTPSYIAYAYCLPFRSHDSPCASAAFRQWLRDESMPGLMSQTDQKSLGFFPPGMKGSNNWNFGLGKNQSIPPKPAYGGQEVRVSYTAKPNPFIENYAKVLQEKLSNAKFEVVNSNLDYQQFDDSVDSNFTKRFADIYLMYTGILIDDPVQDLRFMFLSKEGVRLPDSSGEIKKELQEEPPSVEKINDALERQTIVWPLGHFALGFWYTDDVDTSLLNSTQPPIEFNWVGPK